MNEQPIGIFDSGVGGTTIWKDIQRELPGEHTVYLADSRNAPYGEKSPETIYGLSAKNTEYLLGVGCKLIVVACNTATTNAIARLRETYSIPFIGIEPAIKPAALQSRSGKVGVLATRGTLGSALFHSTSRLHAAGIRIVEQEGRGLVELIEAGRESSPEARELLAGYLAPMLDEGIDHLVLGCTHYPYLMPLLRELVPEQVRIIDCGEAVARQTHNVLRKQGLLNTSGLPAVHRFFTNGRVEVLQRLVGDHTGVDVRFMEF